MPDTTPSQPPVSMEFWSLLVRERVVLLLLATTFGLLAWQRWGMESATEFAPRSEGLRVTASDDRADGGRSICRVETEPDKWRLVYDVREGGNWAYCGINFTFFGSDSKPGIDLSRFSMLVVDVAGYTGHNTSFQTQMKALDPDLPVGLDARSLKHQNMILIPQGTGASRNKMPLDYFVIPPWWVARFKVPVRHLNPTRKDVREIEFMTSADIIRIGTGTLEIRKIEFHGKWIRQDTLLKILFAVWLAYVVAGLIVRLYKSFASIRSLQKQTSQLQELAEHDPLTRLHNRRGLENHLSALASRSIDPANPVMGVMMVDLDHFKTVNDTLGHDAGDEILRRLAQLIQNEMRPNNLAARWGGEEFILLLPGIPAGRLLSAAEKLRARVESELQYKDMRITASIGIAHGKVDEFEVLAKRADEALYRAKTKGRNRVEEAG